MKMGIRNCLDGTSLLEQRGQLALLCLQVRVPANVLATDEDVGDGALASYLGKGVLNGAAIVDLIQFDGIELGALLAQQLLGGAAIRAVGLGEDSNGVLVDDGLDFGLGGGHGGWAGGASEEMAEEGNFGGWEKSKLGG